VCKRLLVISITVNGPIVHPQVIYEYGALVEWYWQGKPEELGEKPVPVPLSPPQIPHGLTRARTQASAVGGRLITVWVMAWRDHPWPYYIPGYQTIRVPLVVAREKLGDFLQCQTTLPFTELTRPSRLAHVGLKIQELCRLRTVHVWSTPGTWSHA
jgi:hypothetical protein